MPQAVYQREQLRDAASQEYAKRQVHHKGLDHARTPANQAIYDACRQHQRRFAETFFPHLCTTTFSSMHAAMFAKDDARGTQRNLRDATAAPRGSAKTTIRGFIKILHDCVYQTERFICIFSHSAALAMDRVKQLRDELETNAALIEVFGRQVGSLWNIGDFITAHGVRVKAASPGSQLRGILQRGSRLTKILLDDFENPEHVLSDLQRMKTEQRFFADIMKLGQPGTNVEIVGTILHPQSLLAKLLENPGFTSTKYKAVLQFASMTAMPLWQQWRTLFLDLTNEHRLEDARAFFDAHEAAMTDGVEVLWPERESYYDLMVMRLVEGETAFWLEKQNEPRGDARYLFDMEAAAYCRVVPGGIMRAGGTLVPWIDITDLAMAYDPTPDKQDLTFSDYAAIPVLAQDRWGYVYVLDCYLKQEVSTAKQIDALIDLAVQWHVPLLGIESNMFASLLLQDIREALAQRAQDEGVPIDLMLVPLVNMRNKIQRIKTLEPLVQNGWLQFNETLPAQYFTQFGDFLPLQGAGHDDGPDSTEMAYRTIRHLWERRDLT